MDRLAQILDSYKTPAYAVTRSGHIVLLANQAAEQQYREMSGHPQLTGARLIEALTHAGIDYDTHPAVRASRHHGPHSRFYPARGLLCFASRLPDVPSRPPAVLVTGHVTDVEPLAAASHLRIVSAFQIATAIDDMTRSLSVAMTMLNDAQNRLGDLGDVWQERAEAYADEDPVPLAEFSLLDAANERSGRNEASALDVLSDVSITLAAFR